MDLRRRRDEDLPGAAAVLRAVHEVEAYPTRWPADPAAWLSPAGLRGAWVAATATGVVGHVALVAPARLPSADDGTGGTGGRTAEVVRLFVDPAHRGRGLGRLLLAHAVDEAVAAGLDVDLQVVVGSPAVDLYARLGWRETRRHAASWVTAGGTHPQVVRMAPPGGAPPPVAPDRAGAAGRAR